MLILLSFMDYYSIRRPPLPFARGGWWYNKYMTQQADGDGALHIICLVSFPKRNMITDL